MKNELIKLSKALGELGYNKHSSVVRGLSESGPILSKIASAEDLISRLEQVQVNSSTGVNTGVLRIPVLDNDQEDIATPFADNSAEITPDIRTKIQAIAGIVRQANEGSTKITQLSVVAYTNDDGASQNQRLSDDRATAIGAELQRYISSDITVQTSGMGGKSGSTTKGFNLYVTAAERLVSGITDETMVVAVRDGGDFYYFVRAGRIFIADPMTPDRFADATEQQQVNTLTDSQSPGKKLGESGNQLVYFEIQGVRQGVFETVTYPNGTVRVVGDAGDLDILSWEGGDTRPVTSLGSATQAAEEAGQVARTEASWTPEYVRGAIQRLLEINQPLQMMVDHDNNPETPKVEGQAFSSGRVRRNMRRLFRRIMRDEDVFDDAVRDLAQEMTRSPNYNYKPDDEASNLGLVFSAAMRSSALADAGTTSGGRSRRRQRRSDRRLRRGRGRARRSARRRERRRERRSAGIDIETLHKTATKKSAAKIAAQKRREKIRKETMR